MLAKEIEHYRPQIALFGLQMEGVRGARHDYELMFDTRFLESRGHDFRIA